MTGRYKWRKILQALLVGGILWQAPLTVQAANTDWDADAVIRE